MNRGKPILTRGHIYEIRFLAKEGFTAREIAAHLGLNVNPETIRRVVRGDTHREVGVGGAEPIARGNRLPPGGPPPDGGYRVWEHNKIAEREARPATAPSLRDRIRKNIFFMESALQSRGYKNEYHRQLMENRLAEWVDALRELSAGRAVDIEFLERPLTSEEDWSANIDGEEGGKAEPAPAPAIPQEIAKRYERLTTRPQALPRDPYNDPPDPDDMVEESPEAILTRRASDLPGGTTLC